MSLYIAFLTFFPLFIPNVFSPLPWNNRHGNCMVIFLYTSLYIILTFLFRIHVLQLQVNMLQFQLQWGIKVKIVRYNSELWAKKVDLWDEKSSYLCFYPVVGSSYHTLMLFCMRWPLHHLGNASCLSQHSSARMLTIPEGLWVTPRGCHGHRCGQAVLTPSCSATKPVNNAPKTFPTPFSPLL